MKLLNVIETSVTEHPSTKMVGAINSTSKQKPLRVLQIIDTLGMGGAETWLMELLRFWSRTGRVQMDFLLTSGNRGLFDEEAANLGAQLFYCRYGRNRLIRFTREFRKVLREGQYNAIHDHQDYTSGWHFLMGMGQLPSVKIAHVHNPKNHITENYAVSPRRKISTAIGRRLLNSLATNVCGTSAAILREYGFEPGRNHRPPVSVAHCGFKVNRFNGSREHDREDVRKGMDWPAEAKIVLFAGRLDRAMEYDDPQNHKNSWFALNVVKLAVESDSSICMIMAGAGDEMRRQLDAVVKGWGLSNKLRLVGVRHDLPRLMRAADVLFFPSRQEGLGMVAVEAQATGLPVLASTGVPQECMVIPELCQFLPLDRSLSEWAQGLIRKLDSPKFSVESCGKAVQASLFSIENSAKTLEFVYSQFAPESASQIPLERQI